MFRKPLFKLSLLLVTLVLAQPVQAHPHLLDIRTGAEISYRELLKDLASVQVVFIGESHDHPGHHRMQLTLIRDLEKQNPQLAVGLEMFQVDFQQDLDRWTRGELAESEFLPIFEQNWSWWPGYRPIFEHARDNSVPLLALNISREITRQVARSGFDSLDPGLLSDLEGVTCSVDPEYEAFIRRALGGHGHNRIDFIYFCEAQLLWDISMARHLVSYLEKNPDHKVVVLSGNGHSWKYGIPTPDAQTRLTVIPGCPPGGSKPIGCGPG